MALLQNGNPADNPLAFKVDLDTIIDGDILNPGEQYSVTGPTIIGGAPETASRFRLFIANDPTDPTKKYINLDGASHWLYTVYLPKEGRNQKSIYLVPTRKDVAYENSKRDLTLASELDQPWDSSLVTTWRQSAVNWITDVSGFVGSSGAFTGDVLVAKKLGFSAVGIDTNRQEKTKNFEIKLQFQANI